MTRHALLVLALLGTAACTADTDPTDRPFDTDPDTDTDTDTDTDIDTDTDTMERTERPPVEVVDRSDCIDAMGEHLSVDGGARDVLFDGEAFWVTSAEREEEETFVTLRSSVTRIACDGSVLLDAVPLAGDDGDSSYASAALNGDVLAVAWYRRARTADEASVTSVTSIDVNSGRVLGRVSLGTEAQPNTWGLSIHPAGEGFVLGILTWDRSELTSEAVWLDPAGAIERREVLLAGPAGSDGAVSVLPAEEGGLHVMWLEVNDSGFIYDVHGARYVDGELSDSTALGVSGGIASLTATPWGRPLWTWSLAWGVQWTDRAGDWGRADLPSEPFSMAWAVVGDSMVVAGYDGFSGEGIELDLVRADGTVSGGLSLAGQSPEDLTAVGTEHVVLASTVAGRTRLTPYALEQLE